MIILKLALFAFVMTLLYPILNGLALALTFLFAALVNKIRGEG